MEVGIMDEPIRNSVGGRDGMVQGREHGPTTHTV